MQAILKKKLKKNTNFIKLIKIRRGMTNKNLAILQLKNRHFICALGKTGVTSQKLEGDSATPLATMAMLACYYKPTLKSRPRTSLPMRQIKQHDGWCDDPKNRNYNRFVCLPYRASAESLIRADHLYDYILILDWNVTKRIKNRGSAIFMHIAKKDYSGTEGCVAINKRDMAVLLPYLNRKTKVQIYQ